MAEEDRREFLENAVPRVAVGVEAIKATGAALLAAAIAAVEAACNIKKTDVAQTRFIPTQENLADVVVSAGNYGSAYEAEINNIVLDADGENIKIDLTQITSTGHGVITPHGEYTLNRYHATFSDGNRYPLYEVVHVSDQIASENEYSRVLADALKADPTSEQTLKVVGYVRPGTPYVSGTKPQESYFLASRLATPNDLQTSAKNNTQL